MLDFNGRIVGKTLEEDNYEIIIDLEEIEKEIEEEAKND